MFYRSFRGLIAVAALVWSSIFVFQARAAVTPHALISEGMVLQQGKRVTIWRTAAEDEKVAVSFQGQEASTHARNGRWTVHLENLKAGGPFPMTITGSNVIVYDQMKIEGGKVVLSFKHTGGGLVAKGGPLTGFTIAGSDRRFVNAEAKIDGDRVIVSSAQAPHPVAVRFGWADYPVVNLWNGGGLPASPFKTDDFPWVTRMNK